MRACLPNLLRPSSNDPFTPEGFSEADRVEYALLKMSDRRFAALRTEQEHADDEAWLNFDDDPNA